MVQEEITFKDSPFLQLWWPSCFAERNHLGEFCRGHYEELVCEIILNLDQWFRKRYRFKIFLIKSSERYHLGKFGIGHYEEHV